MTKISINSPGGGGGGSGTVTSVAVTTGTTGTNVNVSGSPITTSGTIIVNIPVASSTNTGKLSSTDWSTFNNKQAALVSGTNIKTINGNDLLGAGNLIVGIAGTDGQVQYNNAGVLAGASSLFYDDTNNFVGIGTTSPAAKLDVDGGSALSSIHVQGNGNDTGLNVHNDGSLNTGRTSQIRLVNGTTFFGGNDTAYQLINYGESNLGASFIIQHWNGSAYAERFKIDPNGNVGIGTATPLGILHLKTAAQTTRLLLDGDAGQSKIITFRSAGLQRWGLYSNNVAESGSNQGSDFVLRRYSDAGTLLGTPISVTRRTGQTTISEGLTLSGSELRSFRAASSSLSSLTVDSSNEAALTGTVFVCSGSSVTIDASVTDGFNLSVIQSTNIQTTISVTGGLVIRNRQGHTKIAGQYGTVTLFKRGSDLYLGGDTA